MAAEQTKPKPRNRWPRYSLRTMMAVVTVFCVWLGLETTRARNQKEAVVAIAKLGGQVTYDYQLHGRDAPSGPTWLRELIGEDFLVSVIEVHLLSPQISDADLMHLEGLPKLQSLTLIGTEVTDSGLVHLKHLRQLQVLNLMSRRITDAGLEHLGRLRNLRALRLDGTEITDAGLAHLMELTKLQMLSLSMTRVSDGGLKYLAQMRQLTEIHLIASHVTPEGVKKLREDLPNCSIVLERDASRNALRRSIRYWPRLPRSICRPARRLPGRAPCG